jgi:hypothetical protein
MPLDLFESGFYLAANPDLRSAGLTTEAQLRNHFFGSGLNEGRQFNAAIGSLDFYRRMNPDLTTAGLRSNRQLYDQVVYFSKGWIKLRWTPSPRSFLG